MNKKIILFNGAKECGKNFAIDYLISQGLQIKLSECKDELHNLTKSLFGVSDQRYWQIYNDRSLKELPLSDFHVNMLITEFIELQKILNQDLGLSGSLDLSIRQAMIYVSECIVKPRYGSDFFGKARALDVLQSNSQIFADSSAGFIDELPPLIERLGQDNILLLRVHRTGCTFDGDSRNWIPDGVINNTVDLYNNGLEESYLLQVENVVKDFLYGNSSL